MRDLIGKRKLLIFQSMKTRGGLTSNNIHSMKGGGNTLQKNTVINNPPPKKKKKERRKSLTYVKV